MKNSILAFVKSFGTDGCRYVHISQQVQKKDIAVSDSKIQSALDDLLKEGFLKYSMDGIYRIR